MFLKVYGDAEVPDKSWKLLAAVDKLLGADGGADADAFCKKLENETFVNVGDLTGSDVQQGLANATERLWTSAQTNKQGKEFCQIFNAATRPGASKMSMEAAAVLTRSLNINIVAGRNAVADAKKTPFPPNARVVRGGGLPDEHKDFFTEGKKFRCPNFLATAFEKPGVHAKDDLNHPHRFFLERACASGLPGVRWEISMDERGDPNHPEFDYFEYYCKHVNFISKQAPGLPDEREYLFTPYSVLTVESVEWSTDAKPGPKNPHVIRLRAAVDNKNEPMDLPISRWS